MTTSSTRSRPANSTAWPPSSPTSRKPPSASRSRPGSPSPEQAEALERIEEERRPLEGDQETDGRRAPRAGRAGQAAERCSQRDSRARWSRRRSRRGPSACLPRGNWLDESGPVVPPALPAFLPPLGVKDRRATRLDLARWLVAGDNPLVARVMVNRLWKLVFGQGLVTTLDDFGSQGAWPTHPELLDWLACEFVDGGWNVKAMLKLMVMSETYRQSSTVPRGNAAARSRQPLAGAAEPIPARRRAGPRQRPGR